MFTRKTPTKMVPMHKPKSKRSKDAVLQGSLQKVKKNSNLLFLDKKKMDDVHSKTEIGADITNHINADSTLKLNHNITSLTETNKDHKENPMAMHNEESLDLNPTDEKENKIPPSSGRNKSKAFLNQINDGNVLENPTKIRPRESSVQTNIRQKRAMTSFTGSIKTKLPNHVLGNLSMGKISTKKTNTHFHNPIQSSVDDEYFNYEDEKPIELTKEEREIFGNRAMRGHQKIRLLGKGGCGIVWLCMNNEGRECAVKQISKKSPPGFPQFSSTNILIARNEIEILKKLNAVGNDEQKKCPYIIDIYNSYEDNNDIWFSFEKGGKCLSSLSFKIKGEFLKNERIYSIKKGRFVQKLFENPNQFKILIRDLLHAINYINSFGIIHADIKPENILIDYVDLDEEFRITKVKVIDFGSAFYSENPSAISSNTPEYLCPEITEIMEGKAKNKKKFMSSLTTYVSCVDIWSLGVTLLELVLSCPVWMSYKAKVVINSKSIINTGLFGFKGRDGNKIHHKQIEVANNLHKILSQSLIYGFPDEDKENFEDLLKRMLCQNFKERISPKDALEHDFLKDIKE